LDSLLTTMVEGEYIYGVAAITTEVVETARRIHGASPTATAALGRLLTGGLLLGALLKEPSHRLILQITGRGPLQKVVVEADGAGHVRGYPGQAAISVPSRHGKLDVGRAVGKGVLHVIKDLGVGMPSSGTIPLATGEIAEDLAAYLQQSEQIPGAVSLGVFIQPDYVVNAAGGLLIQLHTTVADDLVDHIERALAATPAITTMIREGCQPYDMLHQAFGDLPLQEIKHLTPAWSCQCSRGRVIRALVALGADELRRIVAEEPSTEVRCEFCTTAYVFQQHELMALLEDSLQPQRKPGNGQPGP
jgi:molecular chaperone Hsp33